MIFLYFIAVDVKLRPAVVKVLKPHVQVRNSSDIEIVIWS